MTDERKKEFTLRITQANASGLVVILYEMFLAYLEDAEASLAAGKETEYKRDLRNTRGCLEELMCSLHPEYEIAGNLMSLYLYVNRMLIQAQIKKDVTYLKQAESVMRPLCEVYRTVSTRDTSQPLMQNTQTVVAGMTYGRDSLHENMEDQGASRGYFV